MIYIDIPLCEKWVFEFIHVVLTNDEPAPDYRTEQDGIAELAKVLNFVRNDVYYPEFADKAAYMLCSIAGAQYFSNGNKRLAVVLLISFLIINQAEIITLKESQFKEILGVLFPAYVWEEKPNIQDPHAQFLYNLAVIIGSPDKWDVQKFDDLKKKISSLFMSIYKVS